MAEGLVLTHEESARGVHETAQRGGDRWSQGVVRGYIGYEEWPESGFVRREVARYGVALILGFGDPLDVYDKDVYDGVGATGAGTRKLNAFVVGNQLSSSQTSVGGHQLGVQVELTPAGALALFGDVRQLNDSVIPLDDALGTNATRLVERLAETPSWAERLDLLDAALGRREDVPVLMPEVAWLRGQLERSRGRARVEPLMDETGWSRRHVTERFRRQLGVSPKSYARLLRFEHATGLLAEKRAGRTIAEVAVDSGYYDQSHLTRDFLDLGGVTPGSFLTDAEWRPEVRFLQDEGPLEGAQ